MQTTNLKNTMIYDKELLEHVKWLYKPPETHWCSTYKSPLKDGVTEKTKTKNGLRKALKRLLERVNVGKIKPNKENTGIITDSS